MNIDPIEFHEIWIPEFWLCCLLNDDHSGYTDEELAEIDKKIGDMRIALGTNYEKELRLYDGILCECVAVRVL